MAESSSSHSSSQSTPPPLPPRNRQLQLDTPTTLTKTEKGIAVTAVQKDSLTYDRVRYRAFFESSDWPKKLGDVTVSSDGAKGVFFVKTTVGTKRKTQRVYVIKPTSAPEQVLLSEWALKKFAFVKTPKSQVAPLLDQKAQQILKKDYGNNEIIVNGAALYNHIIVNIKEKINQTPLTEEEKKRYEQSLDILKRSSHLIVMKLVGEFNRGTNISGFDGEIKKFLKEFYLREFANSGEWATWRKSKEGIDYFNNNKLSNKDAAIKYLLGQKAFPSSIKWILEKVKSVKSDELPDEIKKDKDFIKKVEVVYEVKKILSSPLIMEKIGRILAVDCLLGNGDRLGAKINLGNLIFLKNDKGEYYDIAVIDNDSFMPVYRFWGDQHNKIEKFLSSRDFLESPKADKYLLYLFSGGHELTDEGDAIQFPNLKKILSNFDKQWFSLLFCSRMLGREAGGEFIDLVWEILSDNGTRKNQIILSLKNINSNESYTIIKPNIGFKKDPETVKLEKYMRDKIFRGFFEVMHAFKAKHEYLDLCLGKIKHLKNLYSESNINFDPIALQCRIEYSNNLIDNTLKGITSFDSKDKARIKTYEKEVANNHKETIKKIKDNLFYVDNNIKESINFCVHKKTISPDTADGFLRVVNIFPKTTLSGLSECFLPKKTVSAKIKKMISIKTPRDTHPVDINTLHLDHRNFMKIFTCVKLDTLYQVISGQDLSRFDQVSINDLLIVITNINSHFEKSFFLNEKSKSGYKIKCRSINDFETFIKVVDPLNKFSLKDFTGSLTEK